MGPHYCFIYQNKQEKKNKENKIISRLLNLCIVLYNLKVQI